MFWAFAWLTLCESLVLRPDDFFRSRLTATQINHKSDGGLNSYNKCSANLEEQKSY